MALIDPKKDYYAILGISPDSDEDTVKQAYRERARQYHPDSGHGDTGRFRQIQEAYEVLRDTILRRSYDRQRESRGLAHDAPVSIELLQSRTYMQPLATAQMLYVMLDVSAKRGLQSSRQRLNLALVIDRSTSMQGVRMQNVKIAAMDLVGSLQSEDRLALVAFSDRAEVLAPSTLAQNTRVFNSAIAALTPGGGTEIYQGLQAGLDEVRRYASDDYINHVILLTDGRTYGDEELALREAKGVGAQDIGISAFGIGEDWNDMFLDSLARYGGGISKYISSPSQVQHVLKEQIQGLSNILMRRMDLKINPAPYIRVHGAYRASPYMESFTDINDNTISLGNLTAGEPVDVVLELVVNPSETGERRVSRLVLEAEEVATTNKIRLQQDVNVTFSLKPVEEQVPPRLLNHLARLSVFRLQEQAWMALEGGDAQQATRYLEAVATRLFDMGFRELGQAAMLEVGRLSQGGAPTGEGRKKLRYGTRSLSIPSK